MRHEPMWCATLWLVAFSALGLSSVTHASAHVCVHSAVSVPLNSLPLTTAVQMANVSTTRHIRYFPIMAGQGALWSNRALPSPMTTAAATTPLSKQLASHGLRPLAIRTVSLLDTACSKVGEVVSTYDGSGQSITCTELDLLTPAKRRYMKRMLASAVGKLSAMLYANPTVSLTLPADACTGVPNAAQELNNTDFVLLVSAMPWGAASAASGVLTIAWGRSCVRSSEPGNRPVIGLVNFIPAGVIGDATGASTALELNVRIAMHEITHALGFTSLASTLNSYMDEAGVRQPSGGVVSVYRPRLGKTVTLVRTPRVLAAARRHFLCESLDGVEIEDMGGSGTADGHWKKRLFYEEALVGTITTAALSYSSLTLAFFEDVGFYAANYDLAEDGYAFGRARGCDFVHLNCKAYTETMGNSATDHREGSFPSPEFCFSGDSAKGGSVTGGVQTCTQDRLGIGRCATATYTSNLPREYQYFANPTLGGSSATMDYCPVVEGYDNINCLQGPVTKPASSDFRLSPVSNVYGSAYGPASRCFTANLATSAFPLQRAGARCFQHACANGGRQLLLQVQGQTVPCPADGSAGRADTTALRGVHGYIECPPAAELCVHESVKKTETVVSTAATESWHSPITFPRPVPAAHGSCEARLADCMDRQASFPAPDGLCSTIVNVVSACIGSNCPVAASVLLHALQPTLAAACVKSRQRVASRCLDGWEGAVALCHLAVPA